MDCPQLALLSQSARHPSAASGFLEHVTRAVALEVSSLSFPLPHPQPRNEVQNAMGVGPVQTPQQLEFSKNGSWTCS